MAWHLSGMYYENCSCTATCPCTWSNMQFPATNERCNATLAFTIDDGDIDGVDVSGHTFVLMVDSPPLMSDGGWNVGVIVDDGASAEQVEAIGAVVSGSLGGPPAALGPLLGNFLGIEQMAVSITTDNGEHDSGEVVSLTGVDTHPAGPVLAMAPVSTSSISAMGISFGGEGLSGFANPFNWAA